MSDVRYMVCEGYPARYRIGGGWWCPKDAWHETGRCRLALTNQTEAQFRERFPDLLPLPDEAFRLR